MRTQLASGVYLDSSGPQTGFSGIPHLSDDIANLAVRARKVSESSSSSRKNATASSSTGSQVQSGRLEAVYYPLKYRRTMLIFMRICAGRAHISVSAVRGEWQQALLDLGLGKKRVRHYLCDEILCHGSPEAPITSEFSRPLVFLEAYKQNILPSSAEIYMSAAQVSWLQDELYATSASGKNEKLRFSDLKPDEGRAVQMKEFAATRKVSFKGDTARFRLRCGATAPLKPKVANTTSMPSAATIQSVAAKAEPTEAQPKAAPTSFISLNRAYRAARALAAREEALKAHISAQKAALPAWRRFYRNLERLGGAALSCDVESWTEDADVLLELGLAWFTWTPDDKGENTEREGGTRHFGKL